MQEFNQITYDLFCLTHFWLKDNIRLLIFIISLSMIIADISFLFLYLKIIKSLKLLSLLKIKLSNMGIGGSEVFLILIVVLLLFGSKKLPEVAKGLGKGMREFKKATDEIKREINDAEIVKDVNNITDDIKREINSSPITKDFNEIGDTFKNEISNVSITKDINDIQNTLKV